MGVNTLVGTSINTPVIINDQVGLSRATSACVVACLFKEFQISASYEGLIETVPGLNATVLKTDIYQTAHLMFNDMPQGDHKKRAKYRFASKTLMRILPEANRKEVEGLIEKGSMTLDLYEILGTCTWVKPQ